MFNAQICKSEHESKHFLIPMVQSFSLPTETGQDKVWPETVKVVAMRTLIRALTGGRAQAKSLVNQTSPTLCFRSTVTGSSEHAAFGESCASRFGGFDGGTWRHMRAARRCLGSSGSAFAHSLQSVTVFCTSISQFPDARLQAERGL